MKTSLTRSSIFAQKLPAIVLFAFDGERPNGPTALTELLRRVGKKEFSGGERQLLLLHAPETRSGIAAQRVLLVGLGKRASCTMETVRRAAGLAAKKLAGAGLERAAVQIGGDNTDDCLRAVVEGALLAGYKYRVFKPTEDEPTEIKALTLCLPASANLRTATATASMAQISCESANYARALGNQPGNVIYPSVLADQARKLARETGLKCTVFDKPALTKRGFGGLLAVGGGSIREPRLIVLEYRGGSRAKNAKPIALVGKAITFDSGGISIKPSDKMDEMKFDKCGGCAVLGAMRAIAKLKLPVNVIGVIASAENMPGSRSYRPGDIVTSYRGTDKRGVTIEVLNTDAEGRVVLGDALVVARQRGAAAIIDLATLTGACVVALGGFAAGMIGNDEPLQEKLRAAADATGERVWPLPLWQEYKDRIKSDVADIKNTGGREGGAITAAAFLASYVGETPWAHLDIAGTAWTTEERAYLMKGATGFGVRLLVELLRRWR